MSNMILIVQLLVLFLLGCFSEDPSHKYRFRDYSVETGFCKTNTSIKVFKGSKEVYSDCSGDGIGYLVIDSLNINDDNELDFIYCYEMQEYSIVGALISQKQQPYYKKVDLIDVFPPDTYKENFQKSKEDLLKKFIIVDVDNDGKGEILTNVILKNGRITPIEGFTDTVFTKQFNLPREK